MSSAVAKTSSEKGCAPLDGLPASPGHSLLGERPGPATPQTRTVATMSLERRLGFRTCSSARNAATIRAGGDRCQCHAHPKRVSRAEGCAIVQAMVARPGRGSALAASLSLAVLVVGHLDGTAATAGPAAVQRLRAGSGD